MRVPREVILLVFYLLMVLFLSTVNGGSQCFYTTNGTDGHCMNKIWTNADNNTPAGCQCAIAKQDGQSTCDCHCERTENKRCILSTSKHWNSTSKERSLLAFCVCNSEFKFNGKNGKIYIESKNVTELGGCIEESSASNFSSITIFILVAVTIALRTTA